MYKNLFNWLAIVILLPSCSKTAPNISAVCEENYVGNCIIKWETSPTIPGQVRVFSSLNPNFIPEVTPVATAPVSDGRMTIVTNNPTQRYYYSMVFDNKHRVKIASRNVNIPGIQNFRDLGGYKSSEEGKSVRWGMVYRSAFIEDLKNSSIKELQNIGIKTYIDLRTDRECNNEGDSLAGARLVKIPMDMTMLDPLLNDIQRGIVDGKRVDEMVKVFMRELVAKYHGEYRQLFEILLDRDNYPVVVYCSSGNVRTGVASALLLKALGVDDNSVMYDYRLSNDYYNIPKASFYAYKLPAKSQEAVTSLYTAKEKFLNAARAEIKKMSGDTPTYLREQIGLSEDEIKKLRSILLE